MKKAFFYIFSIAFLLSAHAASADVAIETSVSSSRVQIGEELTLDIIISNASGSIQKPVFPPLDGFTSYSQGHSQEISIINGRSSSRSVFTYVLIPNSLGRKEIGPFEIPIGGKIFKAPAVSIDVVAASTPASSVPGYPRTLSGPVSAPPPRALPTGNVSNQDIFVKVWLDKDEAFVNEPVTMTYTLYTRLSATYKGFDKEPITTGFWVEDFPPDKTIKKTEQILDGSRYVVADVRKMVLFPTEAGVFTVEPGVLAATVEIRNQDFDSFYSYNIFGRRSMAPPFATQVVGKILPTTPVSVVVKQLPTEGKPASFNGAVGNYRVESSIDKEEVEQGEPVTYRVKITGEGNVNTLVPPAFPKLEDFKVYDSSSSTQLSKERLLVEGEKVSETVLVPRKAGAFTIPTLSFSFFDPRTQTYRELKTFSHSLKVNAGAEPIPAEESSSEGVQPAPKEDVSFVARDIRFIKKSDSGIVAGEKPLLLMPLYWAFNAVFLVLWLGLGMAGEGLKGLTFRRAHRVARAKLRATKRQLQKAKPDEFYGELAKAVNEYFAGKFDIPVYAVNIASIEEKTAGLPVEPVLLNETKELFRAIDQVRFAQGGGDIAQMKEIYERADRVLTNFERLKIK